MNKNPKQYENEKIYHIYNRGVEKRKIFEEGLDNVRFIHDLYEFNDKEPVINIDYYFSNRNQKYMEVGLPYIKSGKNRKLLVHVLAFCLMPNHFHLLIKQKEEGGVTMFMRKLGTGYTNYFNQKYKRSGHLFQGKFKAVAVEHDRQLLHLPYYIHLNPLDLKYPGWREKGVPSSKNAIKFLETYRWSSYLDYTGTKNFPSVTERGFLVKFLGVGKKHKKDLQKWLKERERNLGIVENITLE